MQNVLFASLFKVQSFVLLAQSSDSPTGGQEGGGLLSGLFVLAMLLFVLAGCWKMFAKAGEPGWASIIPIYNLVVLMRITGKPTWWIILMLIPFVNFVMAIIVSLALAKSFGKSAAYGIGCALLGFIFIPLLGFGSAKYIGPQP